MSLRRKKIEFFLTERKKGAQCTDCQRVEAKDFWKSVVQVRQQVKHKRTFLYVEQDWFWIIKKFFENFFRILKPFEILSERFKTLKKFFEIFEII